VSESTSDLGDVIQVSRAGKFKEEVEKNRQAGRIHEPIRLGKLAGCNDNSKIHIIIILSNNSRFPLCIRGCKSKK
jgi:hypothetical protein